MRATQVGVTRCDVAAKRAPIVLAAVGAASLIITPPVALYRDLKSDLGGLSQQVQANTVSIGKIETRLDNVEDSLKRLQTQLDEMAKQQRTDHQHLVDLILQRSGGPP